MSRTDERCLLATVKYMYSFNKQLKKDIVPRDLYFVDFYKQSDFKIPSIFLVSRSPYKMSRIRILSKIRQVYDCV